MTNTNSTFSGDLATEDIYTGTKGQERISQSFTYDGTSITDRRDYSYTGKALSHVYSFDVSALSGADARQKSVIVYKTDGTIDFEKSSTLTLQTNEKR